MNSFYIIGKEQEDYKVISIDLEIFKQTKSLKTLKETLPKINSKTGHISDILNRPRQPIKLYNGILKGSKLVFNSPTINSNLDQNLPITVLIVVYRKDNVEEPIGYICFKNDKIVYINKKELRLSSVTNIMNNGALFDVKEAQLPKLKIEELKYNIGTRVKYQDKEYKIAIKNTSNTDYAIIDETKHTVNVYQDELELLDKSQVQTETQKEEQKLALTFLNGHFTELYNKYKGQEVMKKSYIIRVKLAKPGEKYYNRLEDAHYEGKSGEAVLIGTQNEEWTTLIENVCKKYTLINGKPLESSMLKETPIGIKTIVGENAEKVFAFHIKQNKDTTDKYGVKTSWGAELTINSSKSEHGDGDWVVSYAKDGQIDENNLAVINGLVFKDTYQKWKETKEKKVNPVEDIDINNSDYSELLNSIDNNNFSSTIENLNKLLDNNLNEKTVELLQNKIEKDIKDQNIKLALIAIIKNELKRTK